MMDRLLSIHIPTTPDREQSTKYLTNKILGEYGYYDSVLYEIPNGAAARYSSLIKSIELLIYIDDKQMTIGEKRELLYKDARGVYSWQIDSDDDISDDAIDLILEAIKQEPDCITFQEHCMINGVHYKSNHSLQYGDWEGDGQKEFPDGFHYHRTPFMKSVIKTEIARSVPVPFCRFGEDHQWSQALKPHLKTEVHIDKDIYLYQHISSPHNERYGIK